MPPPGLYVHALGFLDAAEVVRQEQGRTRSATLEFPIRSLYSHAWEGVLKACLLKQGWSVQDLKRRIGHDLERAFVEVDKNTFAVLRLEAAEQIMPVMNLYHRSRFYFYPGTGLFPMLLLDDVSKMSERLRLDRPTAASVFGLAG